MGKVTLFDSQINMVVCRYGDPGYHGTFYGVPLGFTVARNMAIPARRSAEGWAHDFQTYLAHEFGEDFHLEATEDSPVWVATRAWYSHKVHCDPENTHKLAKDILFRSPLDSGKTNNSDKYTGGVYDSPRYDASTPRLEFWVWTM